MDEQDGLRDSQSVNVAAFSLNFSVKSHWIVPDTHKTFLIFMHILLIIFRSVRQQAHNTGDRKSECHFY